MLKNGIKTIKKRGLYYLAQDGNRRLKYKPWLGDAFSFLYDRIMEKSIFPKKFGGDINLHYKILSEELKGVHKKRVLELASGSGSAVHFLPNDNIYTGTDISPGLLKKALKGFYDAGFENTEFYVTSADDLPFDNHIFDVVLCMLSLNFFVNIKNVFQEIKRVAASEAMFICSVPVPERKTTQSTIRGTLYSEEELQRMCIGNGFTYEAISSKNGALLYFKAIIQ